MAELAKSLEARVSDLETAVQAIQKDIREQIKSQLANLQTQINQLPRTVAGVVTYPNAPTIVDLKYAQDDFVEGPSAYHPLGEVRLEYRGGTNWAVTLGGNFTIGGRDFEDPVRAFWWGTVRKYMPG